MYTTLDNLKTRMPLTDIVQLSADDPGAEEPNEVVVNGMIRDAQNKIDSKLRGRYQVPFADPVPEMIEQIAAMIAIHGLYSRNTTLQMSDSVGRQYKTALQDLGELQMGLQVLEGFEGPKSHPAASRVSRRKAEFSQRRLKGY